MQGRHYWVIVSCTMKNFAKAIFFIAELFSSLHWDILFLHSEMD